MTTPNARRLPIPARYDGGGFRGHAALYQLEPALTVQRYDNSIDVIEYVIVSTVETSVGVETMAFASDPHGTLLSWEEIDGRPGCAAHRPVLLDMGYPYVIEPGQRAIEEGGPGSDSYMSFL